MLRFIKIFLIFIILYHIIVTVICYGIFWGQYQEIFSFIRDGIRMIFFIIAIITHRKHCKQFLKTWKYPLISIGAIFVFSIVVSQFLGKWRYDILIGIKYGVRYLIIMISAACIGYFLAYEKSQEKLIRFLRMFFSTIIMIVIVWFLRQLTKLMIPEFFHRIGYGPLKDFVFGDNPPIYYLTGYQWTLRRQGIFAWPNNYGYFLIAFLPVILLVIKQRLSSIKKFIITNKTVLLNSTIIFIRIAAIIMTLSRTAFIGGIIWLALTNITWIKSHKKIARTGLGIIIAGLIGLSILKGESTLGHIQAKFGSIKYIIQQPGGYGLGTSGPAIHHNGTILPENYYMQLMLDIGTIGFLLRTIITLQIMWLARKIQTKLKSIQMNANEWMIYRVRTWLNIGRFSLLVMGVFLHVFEDSMVNYLFFVIWWILTGYLSTYIEKKD